MLHSLLFRSLNAKVSLRLGNRCLILHINNSSKDLQTCSILLPRKYIAKDIYHYVPFVFVGIHILLVSACELEKD